MKQKAQNSITNLVNIILPLVLVLEYVSAVFAGISFGVNIVAALLIMVLYLRLLLERNCRKSDIFFMLATLIIIIASSDPTRISILCVYVLFSLMKYYDKRTLKNCLITTAVCLFVIVLSYLLFGFNRQYDTEIYRPLSGVTVSRRCFGFTHPNQFTIYLLAFTILVYLATNKFWLHTIVTALDIIFFNATQSRTVLYVILFIFIAMVVIRVTKLRNLKRRVAMPIVFVLFIFMSIVLSVYFAGTKLDVILTGRLALNKQYLASGVSLFGTDEFDNTYFDNSYIHMLVTKGLVYSIIYSVFLIIVLCKKKFSWASAVLLMAIFLEAFMEVIFLKYSFMIIIPLICKFRIEFNHDTQKDPLLLVRNGSKI